MADLFPRILATRQRSKSLSAVVQRRPQWDLTAPGPAQRRTPPVNDMVVSRCACGRPLPLFATELQQRLDIMTPLANPDVSAAIDQDEIQANAGAEEQDEAQVNADMQEQYDSQVDIVVQEQRSSSDGEDLEDDGRNAKDIQDWINEARDDTEDSETPSFHIFAEEMEDETTLRAEGTSTISPPRPPLPAPNNLTITYLPFNSHRALTNHLSSSRISTHLTDTTPFFLHSTLQLPSTLCHTLKIRLPTILRRLTPAILPNHTTNVNPDTLLPSVIEAKTTLTHHHVQGLLFFAPTSTTSIADIINEFYQAQAKCEMRKVDVEIEDAEGKRQTIAAWTWVSGEQGIEEWWTLEDFVAGKVVGLGAVDW